MPNPDSPVGKLMTLGEAIEFFERCQNAEKAMGPLTREERLVILGAFGKSMTHDELVEFLQSKRALFVKGPDEKTENT